tara:strand:+ start:12359 stop:12481 length:123 start_codon:yes stop_codon:yes gene_type:complete
VRVINERDITLMLLIIIPIFKVKCEIAFQLMLMLGKARCN